MNNTSNNGLVIANLGASLLIENKQGQIIKCHTRRKFDLIVCGDRVLWTALENNTGLIESLLPRHSELSRINKQGKAKPLAANIDRLVIVSSIKPRFDQRLIDTYLVVAENMKADSLIVFNKEDLYTAEHRKKIITLLSVYERLAYKTLLTSQDNLSALRKSLSGGTSILIGQSGVGKSTLIQSLIPDADIRVGNLTKAAALGSHTTTTTMLYHLEHGGHLIDSPGVREFIPDILSVENIRQGFIEIKKYSDQCRFRDCTHSNEPDCAVLQAVKEGEINLSRWENYQHLLQNSR